MFPGLGHYFATRGENLVNFGMGGGIPFYDLERILDGHVTESYASLYGSILDYVRGDSRIKTVILMNKSLDLKDDQLKYKLDPNPSDVLDAYGKAMSNTIEKLVSARKQVIFVIDSPMVGFDPTSCISRPYSLTPARSPCAVSRRSYDANTRLYRDKIDEILRRFPTVKRWDLAKYLCDGQYCWAMADGKVLYGADGHHLTSAASYWLADRYLPE